MFALTKAIVSHDLQGIANAVKAHPEQMTERNQGWLPIEWAERGGNILTLARSARIMQSTFTRLSTQSVLKSYFQIVTTTEYEEIPIENAVQMVWDTVFDGAAYKVDRWQRPLIASEDHAQDIRYLIDLCNIKTVVEFSEVVANA